MENEQEETKPVNSSLRQGGILGHITSFMGRKHFCLHGLSSIKCY